MSARGVFDRLSQDYGVQLSWESYLKEYQDLAAEIYGNRAEPVPGALELIAFLNQSQFQLALATSAPREWVHVVLERFFLAPRFQSIVTADDVGKNTKPSPQPYILAVQGLGREASQCVAFEDSPKGIESSQVAGLRCVALQREHNQRHDLSSADRIIGGFEEIPIRGLLEWVNSIPFRRQERG